MANTLETIVQVGHAGITENIITQSKDALLARELIKVSVLETAPVTVKEAAERLSAATRSDVVQVIGTKFVLFKPNAQKPVIRV